MSDDPVVEIDDRTIPREARPFQGHRAGVVTRTIAGAVDLAVVVSAVASLYLGWSALVFIIDPSGFAWPEPPFFSFFIIGEIIFVTYLGLSWWATGRSWGNQVMGLRVVNFRGNRLKLPTAVLRALISTLFLPGLYLALVSRANRSVADVLLRTSVIYDWQVRQSTVRLPARSRADHDETRSRAADHDETRAGAADHDESQGLTR